MTTSATNEPRDKNADNPRRVTHRAVDTDIIYIATPYTDPDPAVRDGRWHLANLAAAHVIKTQSAIVYSPITMTDPLDRILAGSGKTLGSDYWVNFDEAFMATCSSIIVLKVPGWDKSRGVAREIERFKDTGRPIAYLEQEELFSGLSAEELRAVPANVWLAVSNDIKEKYKPQPLAPGAKMDDGTVYAGISPETGKAMYAMPADASLTMTFNEAKEYAQGLNAQKAHGHDDWRVPTQDELNVLFNNRAAIGGLDISGSGPSGWHWSASSYVEWGVWCQRFSDGFQLSTFKDGRLSVRLVRGLQ